MKKAQLSDQLNEQPLVTLANPVGVRGESIPTWDFIQAQTAVGAGCGIYSLEVMLPDGRSANLLGPVGATELDQEFHASADPFRSNIFFHAGAAPLFPLSNRLRGEEIHSRVLQAVIEGKTVTVPANRKYGADGKFCHLHGLIFGAQATSYDVESDRETTTLTAQFPELFGGFWIGKGMWTAKLSLRANTFRYEFVFENTGTVAVPVGAGSHPYFRIPSLNPQNIALHIPAKASAEIDNYTNVFPTGKITALQPHDLLHYGEPRGQLLGGRYIDNCWTDLKTDQNGCAYAEIFDRELAMKVRITATEQNVIGIQAYAPKNSTTVAIELVTHLPDPRREVWGEQPTGMKLLAPGERFHYGYQVEVLPA